MTAMKDELKVHQAASNLFPSVLFCILISLESSQVAATIFTAATKNMGSKLQPYSLLEAV